jgi:hypothetical protein
MKRTYTIEFEEEAKRWRLRLFEDGEDAGGGVFPDDDGEGFQDAQECAFDFTEGGSDSRP